MIKRLLPLVFITLLFSCNSEENEVNTLIIEPAGAAQYYINNKTDIDFTIVITTSVELGSIDSTTTALNKQSTLIYTDGIIGVNPVPTNTFKDIQFYSTIDGTQTLLLEFSPVSNDDWNIIEQDLGETGYGLTKYEMLLTENLLDNNN